MNEQLILKVVGRKDDPDGALLSLARGMLDLGRNREAELQQRNDRQAAVIKETRLLLTQSQKNLIEQRGENARLYTHAATLRAQRDAYAEALGKLGEVADVKPADEPVKHST